MKKSNLRTIGTALSILGVAVTGYLAYQGGIKASEIIKRRESEDIKDESKLDTVKRVARNSKQTVRYWAPAAISGSATITLLAITHCSSARTIATLSGLAASSRGLYNRAKKRLKEDDGTIRKYIDDFFPYPEVIRDIPDSDILKGNEPEELFYDSFLDQFFYSSRSAVSTMISEINIFYHEHDYATLYEMYKMIGLPFIDSDSDAIGWSVVDKNEGLENIWIDQYTVELDDGEYCTVIDYDCIPAYLG